MRKLDDIVKEKANKQKLAEVLFKAE